MSFDYLAYVSNPQFALYADSSTYPQALLQNYWNVATNYISDSAVCGGLVAVKRQYAVELMMSHIIFLTNLVNAGTTPSIVGSATIDKVSVTAVPPPMPSQFEWWLGTSPFGSQLLALLQIHSVGGMYVGGSPVQEAFKSGRYC